MRNYKGDVLFTEFPRVNQGEVLHLALLEEGGRLIGPRVVRTGPRTFYFPLVTSIISSIVISAVFWSTGHPPHRLSGRGRLVIPAVCASCRPGTTSLLVLFRRLAILANK